LAAAALTARASVLCLPEQVANELEKPRPGLKVEDWLVSGDD